MCVGIRPSPSLVSPGLSPSLSVDRTEGENSRTHPRHSLSNESLFESPLLSHITQRQLLSQWRNPVSLSTGDL